MIKNLDDKKLLTTVKNLVFKERQTLKDILEHLAEVNRRRLFADLGHSSLFKYLVKELKYSEGAAARRIGAFRLTQKTSKAKDMIANGELSLSVASAANNFSKKQEFNFQQINNLLLQLKNKTKDQCNLELLKLTPGDPPAKKAEVKKRSSIDETRLSLTFKNETMEKLNQLKGIRNCRDSASAIDYALELALQHYKQSLLIRNKVKNSSKRSRHIPTKVKKELLLRSNNMCEFAGCDERHFLEVEHIKPFAKGGTHDLANLKIYYKAHNQRSALKFFGNRKMDSYLNT